MPEHTLFRLQEIPMLTFIFFRSSIKNLQYFQLSSFQYKTCLLIERTPIRIQIGQIILNFFSQIKSLMTVLASVIGVPCSGDRVYAGRELHTLCSLVYTWFADVHGRMKKKNFNDGANSVTNPSTGLTLEKTTIENNRIILTGNRKIIK